MCKDEYQADRDPNFLAYQRMLNEGAFKGLPSMTYVAILNGICVGSDLEIGKLINELHDKGLYGSFIHLAGAPFQTVHIPTVFIEDDKG